MGPFTVAGHHFHNLTVLHDTFHGITTAMAGAQIQIAFLSQGYLIVSGISGGTAALHAAVTAGDMMLGAGVIGITAGAAFEIIGMGMASIAAVFVSVFTAGCGAGVAAFVGGYTEDGFTDFPLPEADGETVIFVIIIIDIAFDGNDDISLDLVNQAHMGKFRLEEQITGLGRIIRSAVVGNVEIWTLRAGLAAVLQNTFGNICLAGAPADEHGTPCLVFIAHPHTVLSIVTAFFPVMRSLNIAHLGQGDTQNILALITGGGICIFLGRTDRPGGQ